MNFVQGLPAVSCVLLSFISSSGIMALYMHLTVQATILL